MKMRLRNRLEVGTPTSTLTHQLGETSAKGFACQRWFKSRWRRVWLRRSPKYQRTCAKLHRYLSILRLTGTRSRKNIGNSSENRARIHLTPSMSRQTYKSFSKRRRTKEQRQWAFSNRSRLDSRRTRISSFASTVRELSTSRSRMTTSRVAYYFRGATFSWNLKISANVYKKSCSSNKEYRKGKLRFSRTDNLW